MKSKRKYVERRECKEYQCKSNAHFRFQNGEFCFGYAKKPEREGDVVMVCLMRDKQKIVIGFNVYEAAMVSGGLSTALAQVLVHRQLLPSLEELKKDA